MGRFAACSIIALLVASPLHAESGDDAAAAVAVVDAYHAALAAGQAEEARALLAPDLLVLEQGGLEDRDHFLEGHFAADMAFAQAVTVERNPPRVQVVGDVAWVASTSRAEGVHQGRPVRSRGAELAVLTRSERGWRIQAVHWSSRPLPRKR